MIKIYLDNLIKKRILCHLKRRQKQEDLLLNASS